MLDVMVYTAQMYLRLLLFDGKGEWNTKKKILDLNHPNIICISFTIFFLPYPTQLDRSMT